MRFSTAPYFMASLHSGLTYWRLNENELYHPLPDSFDSGAYLLLQEASMSLVSSNRCDRSDIRAERESSERGVLLLEVFGSAAPRTPEQLHAFIIT